MPSLAATPTTACPQPVPVKNQGGTTLVTNAGSNGKFLGVLDFDVNGGKIADFRYRLLPVFSNLLPADPDMAGLDREVARPVQGQARGEAGGHRGAALPPRQLQRHLDQLILDALMEVKGAEIAFSPGFRWGTTLLPGQPITHANT